MCALCGSQAVGGSFYIYVQDILLRGNRVYRRFKIFEDAFSKISGDVSRHCGKRLDALVRDALDLLDQLISFSQKTLAETAVYLGKNTFQRLRGLICGHLQI